MSCTVVSNMSILVKIQVVQAKAEEKNQGVGTGGMVPRQFLEIGPSGTTAEVDDQVSNSSSDERTRSNTPQVEAGTIRDHTRNNNNGKNGREDSPESESQGWGPNNKVQKLNNPSNSNNNNAMDQSTTDATMRKARVSVRARSEASMVIIN